MDPVITGSTDQTPWSIGQTSELFRTFGLTLKTAQGVKVFYQILVRSSVQIGGNGAAIASNLEVYSLCLFFHFEKFE